MPSKLQNKIETFANVAIIAVALLLGYFLVQNILFPSPKYPAPIEIKQNAKVNVPDVDWKANQRTLVLFIRKGCHFCTESMPFYKTLATKPENNTKIMVVSTDSAETSDGYLKENGVEIQNIRQADLSSIGVRGTPTLLLVNDKGEVSDSWVGKLSPDGEKEVISQLLNSQS